MIAVPAASLRTPVGAPVGPGVAAGSLHEPPAAPGDRVALSSSAGFAARRFGAAGSGVRLITTPAAAAAIRAGAHQIRTVDGTPLAYPSQNLAAIESTDPSEPGQTHALSRHVGQSLADDVDRLEHQPAIRAAGGYFDRASAQLATDRTIANPANQRAIGAFLSDPGRLKIALERVDVGRTVGASATRHDVDAGTPALIPGRTATVVLIKDPTFPEGYRILTTYPDTRAAEVDRAGAPLP